MPNIGVKLNNTEFMHVVVAVIYDELKEHILIAKRPADTHQGGKWEFPGGKVEMNESAEQALQRELDEELGVQALAIEPLIQIRHEYADQAVFLDVYEVSRFSVDGFFLTKGLGKEGQDIRWVKPHQLADLTFPGANRPIIRAINLPDVCLITPEEKNAARFLESLEQVLVSGVSLILFRAKQLSKTEYLSLGNSVIELAHQYRAKVLLNSPPQMLAKADGLHLTSRQLMALNSRPELADHQMLSASCHHERELKQAKKMCVDCVFLSPVNKTSSHPQASAMGWERFQQLVCKVNVPVYALGGLGRDDLFEAKKQGAQGIAAISALWKAVKLQRF